MTLSNYAYFELVDLSATGAKLRGSSLPATGKTGLFRLGSLQALCKIVWAKGDTCGVQFDETIPPRILAQLLSAGPAQQAGFATSA